MKKLLFILIFLSVKIVSPAEIQEEFYPGESPVEFVEEGIRVEDKEGKNLWNYNLLVAARDCDLKALINALNNGAEINFRDLDNNNAFTYAATMHSENCTEEKANEVMLALIKAGINVDENVLTLAVSINDASLVDFLFKNVKKIEGKDIKEFLNEELIHAAMVGHEDMVKLLISLGADPNYTNEQGLNYQDLLKAGIEMENALGEGEAQEDLPEDLQQLQAEAKKALADELIRGMQSAAPAA